VEKERFEEFIAFRVPARLGAAIKRESRLRCVSVSSLVREELARALLKKQVTARHNELTDPDRAAALDTD